jgi:hypothetical protein
MPKVFICTTRKTSAVIARCDEVSHRGGHRAGQAVHQAERRVALRSAFPQLGKKHQHHSAHPSTAPTTVDDLNGVPKKTLVPQC